MTVDISQIDISKLKYQTDLSTGGSLSSPSTSDSLFSNDTVVNNSGSMDVQKLGQILGGTADKKTTQAAQSTPSASKTTKPAIETVTVAAKRPDPVKLNEKLEPVKLNITADQIALPKALADLSPEQITASADSQHAPDHTEHKPESHPQQEKPESHKPQEKGPFAQLARLAVGIAAGYGAYSLISSFFGGGHRHENYGRDGRFASNGFNGFGNYSMINQYESSINHIQSLLADNRHMNPKQRAFLERKLIAEQDKYDNLINRMSHFA